MKLDNEFEIVRESHDCFSLIKTRPGNINPWTKEPSKPQQSKSYHSSLETALRSYCRQSINDCSSISDVLLKIDQLYKKINSISEKNIA